MQKTKTASPVLLLLYHIQFCNMLYFRVSITPLSILSPMPFVGHKCPCEM